MARESLKNEDLGIFINI